ncbi:putative dnaJ molecular chaperone homology domain [Lyophyllum shimeji]|uniref:DnaJ molecular chaperone homology domain n=1 Tax=Lyophyllum shimeji TaxID=47721 RepID=A0A9P3PKK4_LYOSH|nr:putative dnaJ molecular chaperone homology domain [Lyophyllum shimeji]
MFPRPVRVTLRRPPPWIAKRSTASTTTNPYPFPSHRNPTPHQIFHLPKNASENDIKERYYDLVRVYHPDKAGSDVSSEIAHARFQSITKAYDALRRRAPLTTSGSSSPSQDTRYPTAAAWRARSRQQELYAGKDERWKDRVILFGVVATVVTVVAQVFSMRRQALAEAVARNRDPDPLRKKRTPVAVSSLDPQDPDRRLGE